MQGDFRADTIAADTIDAKTGRLLITLADAKGEELTISISTEVAGALARLTSPFMQDPEPGELTPTKMPSEFAIGTGRFEPIVLIRFENDVPYGLSADHAMRLGRALISEAKQMAAQPPPLRQ